MKAKTKGIIYSLVAVILSLLGYTTYSNTNPKDPYLRIMSYNVQNLVDSNLDGNEYEDMMNISDEEFKAKTSNIAKVISAGIKEMPFDIILLQEIENQNALSALSNEIYLQSGVEYPYSLISCDYPKSKYCPATNNAYLSKIPIKEVKIHNVGHYIEEIHLEKNGIEYVIFNTHLKSGSTAEDIEKRKKGAELINSRISELGDANIILGGDFNSNYLNTGDVFNLESPQKNRLNLSKTKDGVTDSKYYFYCDSDYGTYYYKGQNECLDYFLISSNIIENMEITRLGVFKFDFLFWKDKVPYRFDDKLEGYSDHLPIYLEIKSS